MITKVSGKALGVDNRNGTVKLSCLKMKKHEVGCWLCYIVTIKFTRNDETGSVEEIETSSKAPNKCESHWGVGRRQRILKS